MYSINTVRFDANIQCESTFARAPRNSGAAVNRDVEVITAKTPRAVHHFTMGWLPSIFGGEKAPDPLSKLDPKLREFLEKESPVKYTTSQSSSPAADTRSQATPKAAAATEDSSSAKAAVPSQSLYQDGRYAHLWKNYRPLAQVESESATDHDKLMDVLEGFKERKALIGRAALENCAIQQEEWVNCMKNGSWEDQLQMCRHQVRRFERCYTMQSVRNIDTTALAGYY